MTEFTADPLSPCLVQSQDAVPAWLYLTDGRTATQRAQQSGQLNTLVLDLAFDYASAPRVTVASADQCALQARDAMVGLLQSAGWIVTLLDDTPGMAVMRTVAMLANEAADAVLQGVCEPGAVDTAMQKGVNYPCGPLAWAQAIGLPVICVVLGNLQKTYGEDRYRTSAWLHRKALLKKYAAA